MVEKSEKECWARLWKIFMLEKQAQEMEPPEDQDAADDAERENEEFAEWLQHLDEE